MKNNTVKIGLIYLAMIALLPFSVTAQKTDELKAKIEKINKEMQQAMISGNTATTLSYYAKDAVSLPNYSKMAQGIDAIRKSNEQMMASGMKINSFETKTQMVNACDKMITEIGTYNMSFSMQGSPNAMTDTGKYLTIWEQQSDGSLKIKCEIWNTDNYPMGAQ